MHYKNTKYNSKLPSCIIHLHAKHYHILLMQMNGWEIKQMFTI